MPGVALLAFRHDKSLNSRGTQWSRKEKEKIWAEWFGFPAMRMVDGRVPLPTKPGLGFKLSESALNKYPFGGTKPMEFVFHEDGSVAAL
jgi:galactonate dehydratase